MSIKLCHINDIEDPGSKGFELTINQQPLNIFIVKKDDRVFGYINQCPHAGINLEWLPDDFLDMDKDLIQCSVHGALFVIETGECAGGPCNGQPLQSIELDIDGEGNIFLCD
ncbi:MAG: Rieske (2Fe-2S) protein [Gammaproteobacteria bacterium]|nr:Rieske (2Fe-2S) protein [Gammaproteobacteria bacterium]